MTADDLRAANADLLDFEPDEGKYGSCRYVIGVVKGGADKGKKICLLFKPPHPFHVDFSWPMTPSGKRAAMRNLFHTIKHERTQP